MSDRHNARADGPGSKLRTTGCFGAESRNGLASISSNPPSARCMTPVLLNHRQSNIDSSNKNVTPRHFCKLSLTVWWLQLHTTYSNSYGCKFLYRSKLRPNSNHGFLDNIRVGVWLNTVISAVRVESTKFLNKRQPTNQASETENLLSNRMIATLLLTK